MKLLEHTFQLLCIAGAIGMTAFCIYKYLDDASVVSMKSRRFHDTPDDVYPSISICLYNGLFVDTNNAKGSDIEKMLKGLTEFNKSFFDNITYEDMTTTLQIEELFYETFQGKTNRMSCKNSECFMIYGDRILKCFTHDIKFNKENKYKRMKIVMKKTKELMNVGWVSVIFHHPGQLFRKGLDSVLRGYYHKIANRIKFNIQSLSVITNRQTKKLVCNSKIFDDDNILMEKASQGLNCSSKYPGMFKQILKSLFVYKFGISRFYFERKPNVQRQTAFQHDNQFLYTDEDIPQCYS